MQNFHTPFAITLSLLAGTALSQDECLRVDWDNAMDFGQYPVD